MGIRMWPSSTRNSGAVLASIPDLGGADEVWFNEADGHYFIPGCNAACRVNPGSQTEQLGVVDANGFKLDQSVCNPFACWRNGASGAFGRSRSSHEPGLRADPGNRRDYPPFPAIGLLAAPHKVGSPTDATGCIAVFTTTNDDR